MATYNPSTRYWTLDADEVDFALPAGATTDNITDNTLSNRLTGDDGNNIFQSIYGGLDTLVGGKGDDQYFIETLDIIITEHDNEGIDTIFIDSRKIPLTEINYIIPNYIENYSLSPRLQNSATFGNEHDNIITIFIPDMGDKDHFIDGGLGDDTYRIGYGNYTLVVNSLNDKVLIIDTFRKTHVTIQSSITYTLAADLNDLTLTGTEALDGTGNEIANVLIGNGAGNILDGRGGDDTIRGGGGDDKLLGGAGINLLEGGAGADTIDGSGGTAYASYLHAGAGVRVDLRTLDGSANTGDAAGDVFVAISNVEGSDHADTLIGNEAANILKGLGGNDTYVIDAMDVVVEGVNKGIDTLIVGFSASLATYANVENLTASGTASISLTGNDLGNVLTGNAGDNVLNGAGGADTLAGGAGNDTYYIDNAGDVVVEVAGGGTDTAIVSLDFRMDALANVEILKLADGTQASRVTGGGGNDHLVGNEGFNVIDGGAGADTMEGGAGSDVFLVDNAGDVVIETAGNGADAVQASVSYTLSAGAEIEFLTGLGSGSLWLTGNEFGNTISGTAAADGLAGQDGNDVLTGYAGNDTLRGDAGNDTLYGGAGKDTLYGGAGKDTFVFNTGLNSKTNRDKIADFNVNDDTILLDNALFKANKAFYAAIKKGTEANPLKLKSGFLRVGDKAKDGNDYLVYNKKTGILSYDADGSGAKAAVQIATLSKNLKLTYHDFFFM